MQASQIITLIAVALTMFGVIGFLSLLAHYYTLNGIKSRTVGDGQHGTARWATRQEIQKTYVHVPYEPERWRRKKNLPAVSLLRTHRCGGKRSSICGKYKCKNRQQTGHDRKSTSRHRGRSSTSLY